MSTIVKKCIDILTHPITLFLCMGLGVVIGKYGDGLHPLMEIIATLYLRLMNMCILPVVIAVIVLNVGRVIRKAGHSLLVRWLISGVVCMALAGLITLGASYFSTDYMIDDAKILNTIQAIASGEKYVIESLEYYVPVEGSVVTSNLAQFFYDIVPANIFKSLVANETLTIICFFIMVGTMLSYMPRQDSKAAFTFFEDLYMVFSKLLSGILVFLPIGIMAIFSEQFADAKSFELLPHIFPLLVLQIAINIFCILIFSLIISYNTGVNLHAHWLAIKRSFFISIGTATSLACIPAALADSSKYLRVRHSVSDTILPISITLVKPASVILVSSIALYGMFVYGVDITLNSILFLIISSIFYSIAITGVPSLAVVGLLAIVFEPLLMPMGLLSMIYLLILALLDPLLTFTNVYSNIALLTVLDKKHQK